MRTIDYIEAKGKIKIQLFSDVSQRRIGGESEKVFQSLTFTKVLYLPCSRRLEIASRSAFVKSKTTVYSIRPSPWISNECARSTQQRTAPIRKSCTENRNKDVDSNIQPAPVTLTFDFSARKYGYPWTARRSVFSPNLKFTRPFVVDLEAWTEQTDGHTDELHHSITRCP